MRTGSYNYQYGNFRIDFGASDGMDVIVSRAYGRKTSELEITT